MTLEQACWKLIESMSLAGRLRTDASFDLASLIARARSSVEEQVNEEGARITAGQTRILCLRHFILHLAEHLADEIEPLIEGMSKEVERAAVRIGRTAKPSVNESGHFDPRTWDFAGIRASSDSAAPLLGLMATAKWILAQDAALVGKRAATAAAQSRSSVQN